MEYTEKGNQRLVKVSLGDPVPLAVAGNYFKLYQSEEQLILTLDHIHGRTSVYEMLLNSNIKNFRLVNYPSYVTNNPYLYNSNSLLLGDSLVQMAISKEELAVTFHDLRSEEIVREINLSKEALDTIAFGFRWKGDALNENKASKKLAKILKDISNGQAAFTIQFNKGEGLDFTIGTYQTGYEGPLAEVGQPQHALDYVQTEMRQESLFRLHLDPNNNQLPGGSTPIQKIDIEEFKKENKIRSPVMETIFRINDQHFYCWHSLSTNRVMVTKIRSTATEP